MSLIRYHLRSISLKLLPVFLVLLFLVVLAAQFMELGTANELLTLTSFIVLISFSALAFNWSRVSTSFTSENHLCLIYEAGVDFFIASLLALVSTFFIWVKITLFVLPPMLASILFGLHWVFLLLALGLFLLSLLQLLRTAREISQENEK